MVSGDPGWLEPNAERLGQTLDQMGRIGQVGADGVRRLAYSPEDVAARSLLIEWMQAAGLSVRVDAFTNVIGRRAGTEPSLPPLILGSHIDTPPLGGRFDGTVGVLGALEVLRLWQDHGLVTRRPVELISFQCEEPGRFGVSCLGSKAMAGKLDESALHGLTDADGITLWEAIRSNGLDPAGLPSVRREHGSAYAYLELHIEQGRVLEETGEAVGVVTAIAAPTRARVSFVGQADHSGATPMALRRDAACGAAELILALERAAQSEAQWGTVVTVGWIKLEPGVINIVPGRAELLVDIRGVDRVSKNRVRDAFVGLVREMAARRNLTAELDFSVDEDPVPVDPGVMDLLDRVCAESGLRYRRMPSGAGHDAQHAATFSPIGMLFVPSRGGVSHAPEEFTSMDEIVGGVRILARAAWLLSNEAEARRA